MYTQLQCVWMNGVDEIVKNIKYKMEATDENTKIQYSCQVYNFSVEVKQDTQKLEQVAFDNRAEAQKMTEQVSHYTY